MVKRNNFRQLEECSLHDHVDTATETNFASNLHSVYVVELEALLRDGTTHSGRKVCFHVLYGVPVGVQYERAAVLHAFKYFVLVNVGRLVASHVVSLVNKVGGLDWAVTEAQVGYGETARLLGVVRKVTLCVHVGVVTNNLNGLLVCANSTVSAKAEEFALHGTGRYGVEVSFNVKRGVGNVVVDTNVEVVLRTVHLHVVVNSLNHSRREFLGTKTVTASDKLRHFAAFHECRTYVHVQWIADSARFLGTVKHGNGACSSRKHSHQVVHGEWTVQTNLHEANAFASGVQVVHHFFDGFTARAHSDDDALSFFVTNVFKWLVLTASQRGNLLHVAVNDGWNSFVMRVRGFATLVVNVRILSSTADVWVLRIHSTLTELFNLFPVYQIGDVVVVDDFNLLDFVGSTETVKEVAEWYACFNGRKVCHESHVHGFLNGIGNEHSKASLASGHNVLVVAKDGQGMSSKSTCRNVENAWKEFTRNLVHVWNHEQKTLRRREGRGQCTAAKATVNSASGTSFGLKLTNGHSLAKDILFPLRSPFVRYFTHGG